MTYEEIKNECADIQSELETVIPDDINLVIERAKILAVYMVRTGYLLAEAKKLAMLKKSSEICNVVVKLAKEGCLTQTSQNELVKNIAAEEFSTVTWLERLNASCVHIIDLCRTIVSKEKAEMQYLQYQK